MSQISLLNAIENNMRLENENYGLMTQVEELKNQLKTSQSENTDLKKRLSDAEHRINNLIDVLRVFSYKES